MAEVFARLFHVTGDPAWRTRAEGVIRASTGDEDRLVLMPTLLAAADLLEEGVELVVSGAADHPLARALAKVGLAAPDPAVTLLRPPAPEKLSEAHPAHGKNAGPAGAAAYLCHHAACSLPITEPALLATRLRSRN